MQTNATSMPGLGAVLGAQKRLAGVDCGPSPLSAGGNGALGAGSFPRPPFYFGRGRVAPQTASTRSSRAGHRGDDRLTKSVVEDGPAMARRDVITGVPSAALREVFATVLGFTPTRSGEQIAQRRAVAALEEAIEARRSRMTLSGINIHQI